MQTEAVYFSDRSSRLLRCEEQKEGKKEAAPVAGLFPQSSGTRCYLDLYAVSEQNKSTRIAKTKASAKGMIMIPWCVSVSLGACGILENLHFLQHDASI